LTRRAAIAKVAVMRRALLLALVAALALAAAGFASMGNPSVSNCGKLVHRPASVVLTCGDAGYSLVKLHWQSWGGARAAATGAASVNNCTPNCAAGKFKSYPVTLAADRLKTCQGKQVYLRLTVHFTGARPQGYKANDPWTFTCASAIH
jgi:hypothetical protein